MEKKPCEYAGGSCYEMPDVGCDYHGEEALKNKTGYYAVTPMPNKEPTKEWEKRFDKKYHMKNYALYSKEVDMPATTVEVKLEIERAIQEALKAREAELIEKVKKQNWFYEDMDMMKSQVIALIKG